MWTELTNDSLELTSSDSLDNSDDLISISDSDKIDQLTDGNSDSSESENLEIYVGQNKTDDGGDGSPENPFLYNPQLSICSIIKFSMSSSSYFSFKDIGTYSSNFKIFKI